MSAEKRSASLGDSQSEFSGMFGRFDFVFYSAYIKTFTHNSNDESLFNKHRIFKKALFNSLILLESY